MARGVFGSRALARRTCDTGQRFGTVIQRRDRVLRVVREQKFLAWLEELFEPGPVITDDGGAAGRGLDQPAGLARPFRTYRRAAAYASQECRLPICSGLRGPRRACARWLKWPRPPAFTRIFAECR